MATSRSAASARLPAATRLLVSRIVEVYIELLSARREELAAALLRTTVLAIDALGDDDGERGPNVGGRPKALVLLQRLSVLILLASFGKGAKEEAGLDALDAAADLGAILSRRYLSRRLRAPLVPRSRAARRRTALPVER